MSDNEHAGWDAELDFCEQRSKESKQYGCIRRHNSLPKAMQEGACDYRWNGFQVAKTGQWQGIYNKDHVANAKRYGYLSDDKETGKARSDIDKVARGRGYQKAEKWAQAYWFFRFKTPVEMLRHDRKAWYVDHTIHHKHLPEWLQKRNQTAENFKPRLSGGFGWIIPYLHNHHHMIPQGAVREYVIYGDGLGEGEGDAEVTAEKRIQVVISSEWNINNQNNMIILPQEEFIAEIVELPAHCPYRLRSHPEYSTAVKNDLRNIKKKIDKAIGKTKDHKVVGKVKLAFDKLSKKLLKSIKDMPVGIQIGKTEKYSEKFNK